MPRPHEPPALFLDECLDADSVAEALASIDAKVVRHRDHFQKGTADVEWLPEVGKRELIVLTTDNRIRRVDLEMEALWNSGVGAFILKVRGMKGEQIAEMVKSRYAEICRIVHKMARPFVATVTKDSPIRLVRDSGKKAEIKRT